MPDVAAYTGTLLAKLSQLPPSAPNVLLIAIDADDAASLDVGAATRTLRSRADRKDEAFLAARGFTSARAFHDRFLRLGAVITWAEQATGDARAAPWVKRIRADRSAPTSPPGMCPGAS